jgi:methionyl-tRNA synthetase
MKEYTRKRPIFPKRAIVTAGMPYGNKELHFGHVGGVFIHADTYARFLRDRIGEENVIFVSGTDCYGSPILASYKKLVDENQYEGSIEDYVRENHIKQKEVLDKYEINLNLYAASALDRASEIHKQVSDEIFNKLYDNDYLVKLSTPQFYDPEEKVLLNGRQVVGKCPIEGCNSDKGYADECSLGHMYMPSELIDPKSVLSGKTPELREVTNWYFKLDEYTDVLKEYIEYLKKNSNCRKYLLKTIEEFLKPPIIYVKRKQIEGDISSIQEKLPKHTMIDEPKKPSITFVFDNLDDRDKARKVFDEMGLRFRTGKTLVPFRLSGNIDWGISVPEKEDLKDLTFWVWPESLWAPISFARTYLESIGKDQDAWKEWFNSKDSKVYQFIGEDNIYFYGIAEMGMFLALLDKNKEELNFENINLPHLIPNNHVLFMDKKASSSSEIKPPMAHELLDHYTHEQLRMHFLSLGLAKKSVSFMPEAFMDEEERTGNDTVLKDGNLLTNVFNRIIRSSFYTAQKYFDSSIPQGEVSEEIRKLSEDAVLNYEKHMYNHDFHRIIYVLDSYIRKLNKYWVNKMKQADTNDDNDLRKQVLIDAFHGVRTAITLIHPIAPSSCELVREYLNVNANIWNWDYIFEPIHYFAENATDHKLKYLEPRFDFFKKHENQFK